MIARGDDMLTPGGPFPQLVVPLVDAEPWSLGASGHELVIVHVMRGNFCSFCHDSLRDLDKRAEEFDAIGIDIVATSTDSKEEAAAMKGQLGLEKLKIGFGLSISDIRCLGLFATERSGQIFAEPTILIARRNQSVYAVFQNSISCGRTDIDRLLEGLKLLAPSGFPLRGNA